MVKQSSALNALWEDSAQDLWNGCDCVLLPGGGEDHECDFVFGTDHLTQELIRVELLQKEVDLDIELGFFGFLLAAVVALFII